MKSGGLDKLKCKLSIYDAELNQFLYQASERKKFKV